MAATDSQLLYGVGPFGGMKVIPGVFSPVRPMNDGPVNAQLMSNGDLQRNEGALTTTFGRKNFINFPSLANAHTVNRFDVGSTRPYYVGQDTNGRVQFYDLNNNLYIDLGDIGNVYTQAVQMDGTMWLNTGQQLFVTPDPSYPALPQQTLKVAQWQYPKYGGTPSLSKVSITPGLAPQKYFYAFTVVTTFPTINGNVEQESEQIGGNTPYPFHLLIGDTDVDVGIRIAGLGGGINADGLSYAIRIYRMSTQQPIWFEVATTSNPVYIDNATDQSISGNAQLPFSGQPPPLSGTATWPIAEYLDRMWVFSVVQNTLTNNVPQTQLWYSNVGQGWNFDDQFQVLLVGNEATTPAQTGVDTDVPYGAQPTSLIKFGSFLIAFRTTDSWWVTGQDQNTFQVIPLFDSLGCIAPLSPVVYRGILAWLSDTGFWVFDGQNLSWISKDIWLYLQGLDPDVQSGAVGFAWQNYLCWSFPSINITLRWHIPSQQWDTLPFACTGATALRSMGSDPLHPFSSATWNQVVATRANSPGAYADSWFSDISQDLGVPITTMWQGPYTDNGFPFATKTARYISVLAPPQPGVKCFVTLNRNFAQVVGSGEDNVFAPTTLEFDLGAQMPNELPVPAEFSQYTLGSLDISFSSLLNGAPAQVWKVEMYGSLKREHPVKV
jgi:hypothetical protein